MEQDGQDDGVAPAVWSIIPLRLASGWAGGRKVRGPAVLWLALKRGGEQWDVATIRSIALRDASHLSVPRLLRKVEVRRVRRVETKIRARPLERCAALLVELEPGFEQRNRFTAHRYGLATGEFRIAPMAFG